MKRCIIFCLLSVLYIWDVCCALDLSTILAAETIKTYTLKKPVVFFPLKRQTSGTGGNCYVYDKFLINNVRIRNSQPAQIYYTEGDIMPPCLFAHVPSYPEVDTILKVDHIDKLRAILGREMKTGDQVSTWGFFRVLPPNIGIIHISALYEPSGKIEGISVLAATKSLETFKLERPPQELDRE